MKITIEVSEDDLKGLEHAAFVRRMEMLDKSRPSSPVSRLVISTVKIIHRQQKGKKSRK